MPEAARFHDPIGHTSAMSGLLVGVAAGLALAVATVAIVGTGGLAAVAIGAGIAAAGAGGGLAGEYIGAAMTSPSGMIISGSSNVIIGFQPASRAKTDQTKCSKDGPSPVPIAEGSATVYINGQPAARKGDHMMCGAAIASGCGTVIIGGATVAMLPVHSEVPAWLNYGLTAVMIAGTIIATGGAAAVFGWGPALGGLAGGLAGGAMFGWVGGKVGGAIGKEFGNEELGKRIGEVSGGVLGSMVGGGLGGRLGGKFWPKAPAQIPVPPEEPSAFPNLERGGGNTNMHADRVVEALGKSDRIEPENKLDRSITVIQHRDGSVSVGLNGDEPVRTADTKAVVDHLNEQYPEDPPIYRSSEESFDKNALQKNSDGVSPSRGQCSEAKAAQSAGENPSPPVSYQTVKAPGDFENKYPVGSPPAQTEGGNELMTPCNTCQLNGPNYDNIARKASEREP